VYGIAGGVLDDVLAGSLHGLGVLSDVVFRVLGEFDVVKSEIFGCLLVVLFVKRLF
jgi:hypothetical protein